MGYTVFMVCIPPEFYSFTFCKWYPTGTQPRHNSPRAFCSLVDLYQTQNNQMYNPV